MIEIKMALIDDKASFVESMAERIEGAAKTAAIHTDFFKIAQTDSHSAMGGMDASLFELIKEFPLLRKGERSRTAIARNLERVDMALIDFDLRGLPLEEGLITGERIAQLIRHFISTGPIVLVDRKQVRIFDLSHRHPPNPNADFTLRVEDLDARGLWGGTPRGYDPWYWPNLVDTARNYAKRVDFVGRHYEDQITKSLGVPEEVEALLPGEDTRLAQDLRELSFAKLTEGLMLPKEDEAVPNECKHRLAATAIGTWLQSVVLPPQDILIDAPHLVRHCPGLLRGSPIASTLGKLAMKQAGGRVPVDLDKIERHRFKHEFWLDRPVWWLSGILEDRRIKDIAEPWNKKSLALEFAEDSSRFHRPSELVPYESEGFFATRYVRGANFFHGVQYEPRVRLAA